MIDNKKLLAAFESMDAESQQIAVAFIESNTNMSLQMVKPLHYFTKAEMAAGQGYVCAVDRLCKKKTRSAERASKHATTNAELKEFGHIFVR